MAARVNSFACLDPKLAQADHLFLSVLDKAGNTSNPFGSSVTPVTVAQIPGLNTLGIAHLHWLAWTMLHGVLFHYIFILVLPKF